MVFKENTNYDFILRSKQGRTQLIIQLNQQLNMFLKISGGNAGCSPPNCRIS